MIAVKMPHDTVIYLAIDIVPVFHILTKCLLHIYGKQFGKIKNEQKLHLQIDQKWNYLFFPLAKNSKL